MPGDRRRTTGMYTHVDADGKQSRIVNMAADLKVVIGTVVALLGLIVMLAGWFNAHVQSQAIRALGKELTTDGTDVQNAFKALLDERAEEIEAHVLERMDKLQEEHRRLRTTVWRATNPDRLSSDPEPTDEELDR